MEFQIARSVEVLSRTPTALRALLSGLSEPWIRGTEGPDTWSPFDVVGHLIHGERTDWIPRVRMILETADSIPFVPFDRTAHFEASRGKSMDELLDLFEKLRADNVDVLAGLKLSPADMERKGLHPALGPVTLGQLLATWVVHDLNHVAQVSRVMAWQYGGEVGAWREYLPIITDRHR